MRAFVWILPWLVVACATRTPEGAGANANGDDASGLATCEPTPERCDAFGDERPGRLSEHAGAYDPTRGELVVFGGTPSIPVECTPGSPTRFVGETWIYDDACDKWLQVEGEAPSPSGRHMAAWGDGSVWVFGGRYRDEGTTGAYQLYADLFRFDVAKRSWSNVGVEGDVPDPRVNGALVWDSHRGLLWLFGGNASADGLVYEPLDDVWSFDPADARWTRHSPGGGGPAPRLFHAALYDRRRDALVIYGGADAGAFAATAGYFDDLWALPLDTLEWTLLHPGGARAPDGRFWAGLTHDLDNDTYVLFGGHDDTALGNRNDTWRFDPDELEWTLVSEGDVLNAEPLDVCLFPPDFTLVEGGTPERRNAHVMVYSEPCAHTLVFGGKTDCGSIDDVWAFAGERWTERVAASEGEVCLRWEQEPERCTDLCF